MTAQRAELDMASASGAREPPTRRVAGLRSAPGAIRGILRGDVRQRTEFVGRVLTMSDGRTYVPFRQTVKDPVWWRTDAAAPAVLQARFHLRGMGPRRTVLHALFRRVSIVTTPFFVALPGFRSKLWMVDEATGDYAGLYEWDDSDTAESYARGLLPVLRLTSEPGSVDTELVCDTTVRSYLTEAAAAATR
jgi:hypothetical protein